MKMPYDRFMESDVIEREEIVMGNDDSDCHNEYDEKDVETLNKLVASELSAMDEYFDAGKESHDITLKSLYADIGAEERFHSEQLMYAKSVLTGEKYEPRDPEVKKEYEELIEQGMDEETALTTLNDTHRFDIDDGDDSDMKDLQKEAEVTEFAINQALANMELIDILCEYKAPTDELQTSIDTFMETYAYMEAVDNVADNRMNVNKSMNPLKLILNGFHAIIKYVFKLVNLIKTVIRKCIIKQRRKKEWLKRHSIKDLFANGISMYFYSDKNLATISNAPLQYLDLLYRITLEVGKHVKLPVTPLSLNTSEYTPIRFSSISQGLNIVKGAVLTKTKVVVNDQNEDTIKSLFFGYSNEKFNNAKSRNIYNLLEIISDLMKNYMEAVQKFMDQLAELEGNPASVYYTNRKEYNNAVSAMKIVMKGMNVFAKAVSSDLNETMKLNNGIYEQTNDADKADFDKKNNEADPQQNGETIPF